MDSEGEAVKSDSKICESKKIRQAKQSWREDIDANLRENDLEDDPRNDRDWKSENFGGSCTPICIIMCHIHVSELQLNTRYSRHCITHAHACTGTDPWRGNQLSVDSGAHNLVRVVTVFYWFIALLQIIYPRL